MEGCAQGREGGWGAWELRRGVHHYQPGAEGRDLERGGRVVIMGQFLGRSERIRAES